MVGLIVLGIGPANYAVSATIRKWQKEGYASNSWSYYTNYLKENVKENMLSGALMCLFVMIMVVDLLVVKHFLLRTGLFIAMMIATPIILLYFPVSVHFDFTSFRDKLKLIYQLFIRNILWCIVLLLILIIFTYFMLRWLPAYFILIGIASIHFLIALFLKKIYIKEQVWELT